ncbi:MAG: bifunctional metallophosphatase/5'-nucleotidase [Gemmatimonadota bacterium]
MLPSILLLVAALQATDSAHVVVVATTDVRGHATGWDFARDAADPGGLARVATVVDSLRARYPDQVIVVDAGDVIDGDPFAAYFSDIVPRTPHPVMDAMNGVGYDVATPGEREFNFGLTVMNRTLSSASFAYVSGNIRVPGRDTLAFAPYKVILRQSVRIGVTGFTTPGVMFWNREAVRGKLRVERIEQAARPVFRDMAHDADFTIALAHSGMDGPSSYDTANVGGENRAARLADGDVRPDLVVVGHSGREFADSVLNGVHFVQPGPLARSISVVHIDLVRQGDRWRPTRIRAELVSLARVTPSARLSRRFADAQNTVESWFATPIGEAAAPMRAAAARVEDGALTRFMGETLRRAAHADLAATTIYDTRAAIESGEITIRQMYALAPTEATLRAVRINGAQLRAYLEQSARYFYADSTGRIAVNAYVSPEAYDVLVGAGYAIDLTRAPGDRIRDLTIAGRPVQPTDSFTLALSSTRQTGANGYEVLRGAPVVYDRGERIRDLLIAEVRNRRVVQPPVVATVAWRIVPDTAARAARALFVRDAAPVVSARPDSFHLPVVDRVAEARRDSIDRADRLAAEAAQATVTTLKLPATDRSPRGTLGQLVADAYRSALRVDIAIVGPDEIAGTLPAGPLTAAQVSAVLPGGQRLMRLQVSGDDLRWMLEHLVERDEPCCAFSGVTLTYVPTKPVFQRVKQVRFTNGARLDRKATYSLAISGSLVDSEQVMALGGTQCTVALGCVRSGLLGRWQLEKSELTGADAFLDYLRRLPQPVSLPESSRLVSSGR